MRFQTADGALTSFPPRLSAKPARLLQWLGASALPGSRSGQYVLASPETEDGEHHRLPGPGRVGTKRVFSPSGVGSTPTRSTA